MEKDCELSLKMIRASYYKLLFFFLLKTHTNMLMMDQFNRRLPEHESSSAENLKMCLKTWYEMFHMNTILMFHINIVTLVNDICSGVMLWVSVKRLETICIVIDAI